VDALFARRAPAQRDANRRGQTRWFHVLDLFRGGSMLSRLIRFSGNIDVHCVRAEGEELPRPRIRLRFGVPDVRGYALAGGAVAVITVVNLILRQWIGYEPVSLIYLLTVVGLGIVVGRGRRSPPPHLQRCRGTSSLQNRASVCASATLATR
jgi:K+-sensing histidine kinase KdpD